MARDGWQLPATTGRLTGTPGGALACQGATELGGPDLAFTRKVLGVPEGGDGHAGRVHMTPGPSRATRAHWMATKHHTKECA